MSLVPKAVVSRLEELMRRTSARGTERERLGMFRDKPGDHDTKEDECFEQQLIQEAGSTAEQTGDSMKDNDSQEISGTPGIKAERRVDKGW